MSDSPEIFQLTTVVSDCVGDNTEPGICQWTVDHVVKDKVFFYLSAFDCTLYYFFTTNSSIVDYCIVQTIK